VVSRLAYTRLVQVELITGLPFLVYQRKGLKVLLGEHETLMLHHRGFNQCDEDTRPLLLEIEPRMGVQGKY